MNTRCLAYFCAAISAITFLPLSVHAQSQVSGMVFRIDSTSVYDLYLIAPLSGKDRKLFEEMDRKFPVVCDFIHGWFGGYRRQALLDEGSEPCSEKVHARALESHDRILSRPRPKLISSTGDGSCEDWEKFANSLLEISAAMLEQLFYNVTESLKQQALDLTDRCDRD